MIDMQRRVREALTDSIKQKIEKLSQDSKLPLTMNHSVGRGYHMILRKNACKGLPMNFQNLGTSKTVSWQLFNNKIFTIFIILTVYFTCMRKNIFHIFFDRLIFAQHLKFLI